MDARDAHVRQDDLPLIVGEAGEGVTHRQSGRELPRTGSAVRVSFLSFDSRRVSFAIPYQNSIILAKNSST